MTNVNDILAKLDKKTQSRLRRGSEIELTRFETASTGLNRALGGGFGHGRQSLVYGSKSAGKSSVLLESIGMGQKKGLSCAWIDAEGSYDKEWAERLGVNTDELIVSRDKSIHDMISTGSDLLVNGIDVLVVDSISALIPSTYFEKNDELGDGLDKTKQIGAHSKELGIAFNKFNYLNENTALIFISQQRNKFNSFGGASLKPQGGESIMFFSSTVVKLWASASDGEQKKKDFVLGDSIIQQPVGREVTYTVEFNKIGPPSSTGKYDFYYRGDHVGIDRYGEVADLSLDAGFVTKSGAWFKFEIDGQEFKLQGRDSFVNAIKENEAVREYLFDKVENV